MAIVAIPSEPGESIRRDVLPFVVAMRSRFKVDVTDGYARSGHSPTGEHPKGLAIDVVPDFKRGGSWDDVDAAVAWGKTQLGEGKLFRWIGYNGVPNHGRGHHAHFSFNQDAADVLRVTSNVGTKGGGLDVGDALEKVGLGAAGAVASGALGPLDDVAGGIAGAAGAVGGVAGGIAGELLEGLVDILGDTGARVLLYIALVFGGMTLAGIGLARATGVRSPAQSLVKTGVSLIPAGRAAKGASATAKAAA